MENEIQELEKSSLELLLELLGDESVQYEDENAFPSEYEFNLEQKVLAKVELRQRIYNTIADIPSLLGTVADAAQVQTLMISIDMEALDKAKSFAEYKASKIKRIEDISKDKGSFKTYAEASTTLLDNVVRGTIIMPYMVKKDGLLGVIRDVSERATGVARIILEKFKGE